MVHTHTSSREDPDGSYMQAEYVWKGTVVLFRALEPSWLFLCFDCTLFNSSPLAYDFSDELVMSSRDESGLALRPPRRRSRRLVRDPPRRALQLPERRRGIRPRARDPLRHGAGSLSLSLSLSMYIYIYIYRCIHTFNTGEDIKRLERCCSRFPTRQVGEAG